MFSQLREPRSDQSVNTVFRIKASSAFLLAFLSVSIVFVSRQAAAQAGTRWVAAWGASPHAPLTFPGLPPNPMFTNQTVRMVVRPTLGGDSVRIRLSNAFGAGPLTVGAAHLALLDPSSKDHGSKIVRKSDRVITFGGRTSIRIPQGAPALSDPIDLKIMASSEVAVSLYLPDTSPPGTMHLLGQHETYVAGPGDLSGNAEIPDAKPTHCWFWLDELEVKTTRRSGAIVAFGDSITDGFASTPGEYRDWPDLLAGRLALRARTATGGPQLSVINEGIGGNRILHDGAGQSALARFDRDVLSIAGVSGIILLEGINDFGWPHMNPPQGTDPTKFKMAQEDVTADEVIVGMKQIVARAHEHGIRVLGATLLPFEGADYFSHAGEQKRQEVNEWIRTGGGFDGVIDLDQATRDPQHPTRLLDALQAGDHLHPNNAGYKAMADAIDLKLITAFVPPKQLPK